MCCVRCDIASQQSQLIYFFAHALTPRLPRHALTPRLSRCRRNAAFLLTRFLDVRLTVRLTALQPFHRCVFICVFRRVFDFSTLIPLRNAVGSISFARHFA